MNDNLIVSDLFELAALIEQDGFAFYTESAKKLKDIKLISFFHFLAEEELKHERYLRSIKNRANGFSNMASLPKEYNETLKNYMDSLAPRKNTNLKKMIDDVSTVDDALNLALEFEKDSVVFYSMLKTVAHRGLHTMLDEIIAGEVTHIVKIYQFKTIGLPEPMDKHSS